ncbi:unnamed protein product [Somion occarium]|uniref:G-protein coupled receptors family 1 profile domain-containing protein n=1 Tax=Somion occarium TaxID=3059160 RepID=A0ABP1CFD9_9APHY
MDLLRTWLFTRHETQAAKTMYPLLGPDPVTLINVCFIFVTLGDVLLLLLIGTLLFSNRVRRRNASLINLLVVTILCSIPPAMLYFGQEIMNPHPPIGLCFTQAILKHGTDPMFVIASLALVIEFLQGTGVVILRFITLRQLRVPLLVALPYITFLVFSTITAALGGSNLKKVKHKSSQLYCTVDYAALTHGVEFFSVVVVVVTVALEILTISRLRKSWKDVKNQAKEFEGTADARKNRFRRSQAFRVAGFTILQLNYIILCGIDFYFKSVATHILPIVYEALMPLGTFLIFGTTADCMRLWMFWRPRDDDPQTDAPIALADNAQRLTESFLIATPSDRRSTSLPPPPPPKDRLLIYSQIPRSDDVGDSPMSESGDHSVTAVQHDTIQGSDEDFRKYLHKSKDEDEEEHRPSSARAVRFLDLDTPVLDLYLPPEGFSIDWDKH